MPTYDYVCETCGHEFEIFQSMKDKRLTRCPQKPCKGKVHRRIGKGAGFVFKGSGFYITDYRSEGYKAAQKSESKSDSDSAAASPPAAGSAGSSGTEKSAAPAATTPAPKTEAAPKSAKKKSGV